ncbi:hypothetical protein DUNSADRAFT_9653, partial [Dunaliella salina]
RSKRESMDTHSRLRSIYHSTAVSSLEDLRKLTQTISANDTIREQLIGPVSLQGPSSSFSMSQLSFGQAPHVLMGQGTSNLSPANSCQQLPPYSGNSTAVPSMSHANSGLLGTSGSGMVGSLTPTSSSPALNQLAESQQAPRSSTPPIQSAVCKPSLASPAGVHAAGKALDKPSPFTAPMPPSPVSPGSFAFGPQQPTYLSPPSASACMRSSKVLVWHSMLGIKSLPFITMSVGMHEEF